MQSTRIKEGIGLDLGNVKAVIFGTTVEPSYSSFINAEDMECSANPENKIDRHRRKDVDYTTFGQIRQIDFRNKYVSV